MLKLKLQCGEIGNKLRFKSIWGSFRGGRVGLDKLIFKLARS